MNSHPTFTLDCTILHMASRPRDEVGVLTLTAYRSYHMTIYAVPIILKPIGRKDRNKNPVCVLFAEVAMEKFNENLYLADMYKDLFFPVFLVDKLKAIISTVVTYLENGEHSLHDIQAQFDIMSAGINGLIKEFEKNRSGIETVARESIKLTVVNIINHFNLRIDYESAVRHCAL